MNFFHRALTCPECHEPHVEGTGIEKIDSIWNRCLSCGCIFKNSVNFNSNSFNNTLKKIPVYQTDETNKFLSKIPLIWAVKSNAIEEDYIDWVKTLTSPGNFLITWPWDKVKFIPILLTEYLLSNLEKRAIVVDRPSRRQEKNTPFLEPNIFEAFKQTIFLKDLRCNGAFERNLKTEMKKINRSELIKLKTAVECEAKKIGSGMWSKSDCDDTYLRCQNRVKKEYEYLYGPDCIRKIEVNRLNREKVTKWYNDKGEIDLRFTEIEKYMGRIDYDRTWLWEVLLNLASIKNPSSEITIDSFIQLSSPQQITDKRLIFISDEEEPDSIFYFIKEAKPDLVVIPNTDEFIEDRIFNGSKSNNLIKFLRENRNSIVLMFSTSKDFRHLYHIYDEPVAEGCNVIPHTIDNYAILKHLRDNLNKVESRYPNPISSRWEELHVDEGILPETEYVVVKGMEPLDEILPIIDCIQSEAFRNDSKKFVYELQKTLLKLKGAPDLPEVFKRRGKSIELLSYEGVMNSIADRLSHENREKIINVLLSVFKEIDGKEENPLRNAVTEKVNELLTSTDAFITIVVNEFELKGAKVLFENASLEPTSISRFKLASWRLLEERERQIPSGKQHFVITTSYPGLSFPMRKNNTNKFIFLGTKKNLKKMEQILRNRINEFYSMPMYILSDEKRAPNILKAATHIVGGQMNEGQIAELLDEIVVEDQSVASSRSNIQEYFGYTHYSKIRAGEDAIILVDVDDRGMFIPTNTSVSIRNGDLLKEINLGDINSKDFGKELNGSEILLDVMGFHRSFRSMFIIYMLRYASHVTFRKWGYEWKGFENLLYSSQKWILVLRDAIKKYSELSKVGYLDSENFLAEYLAGLQLNARNQSYIKGWWSDFETLRIGDGEFYIYSIEHTKSIHDVRKIFRGINDIMPDMNLSIEEGEMSYVASVFIQDFRRSILSGKNLDPRFLHIHKTIVQSIGEVVKEAQFFKVSNVAKVKIAEEVDQFRVLMEYRKFVEREQ